jgi:hypothetical protein
VSTADFQDRLERLLAGELAEEEARQLFREIQGDPQALEEYLAARELHHDLRRLLAPGSSDEAFLRGILNARSTERKGAEEFLQSVARSHSQRTRPKTTGRTRRQAPTRVRNLLRFVFLAAGLLVAVASLWLLLSSATAPGKNLHDDQALKGTPDRIEREQAPPASVPVEPHRMPDRAVDIDREQEKKPALVPPPEPKPLPVEPKPRENAVERPPGRPAPAPKPATRPTLTAVATIQKTKGDVFVFSGSAAEKTPASDGQALSPGQGIFTEGPLSGAVLSQVDATRLALGAETRIRFAEGSPEIALFQGKLDVEAGPRPPDKGLLLTTPHAEVRIHESRLTLTSSSGSTRLNVFQGAALFTNVWEGREFQVKAGNQAVAQDPPGIDLKRVDEVLRKGISFLKNAPSTGSEELGIPHCDELILLTLLCAKVPETDAALQKYLKNALSAPLAKTYLVSLQAMALEELDRVRYQNRIAECAQFLADNQCANGQWTYAGEPSAVSIVTELGTDVATSGGVGSPDLFGRRGKPKVIRRLQIRKTRSGGAQGDNSNAQYAALGLRACAEAGIAVPPETLQIASGWWRKSQYSPIPGGPQATGDGGAARGWCYHDGKNPVNGGPCCVGAYASMTAGAVSSLMIYDHLMGTDWKKDVAVRIGMNWMSTYFAVARNLNMDQSFKTVNGGTTPPETYLYYNLYALERVGVFSAQEKLGRHSWYAEGAKYLLAKQKADGSWSEASQSSRPPWDTCFAILFLRRATRPLEDVPSVDRALPKDK